jgi:hypothetical protein
LDTPEQIATQGAATSLLWALAIRVARRLRVRALGRPRHTNFCGNLHCLLQSQLCGERISPSGRRCKALRALGTAKCTSDGYRLWVPPAQAVTSSSASSSFKLMGSSWWWWWGGGGGGTASMLTRTDTLTHTLSCCAAAWRGLIHSIEHREGSTGREVTDSGLGASPWSRLRGGQGPWALPATQLDPVRTRVLSNHFVSYSRLPAPARPRLYVTTQVPTWTRSLGHRISQEESSAKQADQD